MWLNYQLLCLHSMPGTSSYTLIRSRRPDSIWSPPGQSVSQQFSQFGGIIYSSENESRIWPRRAFFFLISPWWGQMDTDLLMLAQHSNGSCSCCSALFFIFYFFHKHLLATNLINITLGQYVIGSRKLHMWTEEPRGDCGFVNFSSCFGGCRTDLSSPAVIQAHIVVVFPPKEIKITLIIKNKQTNQKNTTNVQLTSF